MRRRAQTAMDNRSSIRRVPLESRELVTLDASHDVWTMDDPPPPGNLDGAIYRLRPPPEVPPSKVESVRRSLLDAGAAAVKVERPHQPRVLKESRVQVVSGGGLRPLVLRMVDAANTHDRAALRAAIEAALGVAGL